MNSNIDNKKILNDFKNKIDIIKGYVIENLKEETKLMRDSKHPKSDNDRKALLDKMKVIRTRIECYRRVLDDLTYAYIDAYRDRAERIYRRFGYKTAEGYLKDKEIGQMPKLATMIELITNHFIDIPRFYSFGYDYDTATKVVNRDYRLIGHSEYYDSRSRSGSPKHINNPEFMSSNFRMAQDIVKDGSKHK